MKCFLHFGFFLLLFGVHHVAAQENKEAKIERLISAIHKSRWFNGAIVIGQKGKIIFSKGYGLANVSDSVPFTPFTPSDGGSNAKTLTAAAVLLLGEKGKLKLEDPVQAYFPHYPYSHTTVFNLITHSTGGLPDYDYYFENIPDTSVLTTSRMIDVLSKLRPVLPYQPGINFHYDSPGFDIAAAIVEKMSGLSFQGFLHKYFFKPLQMHSAFVRPAKLSAWKGNRTKGYRIHNDSLKLYDIADREGFYGGSNVWFSATDLYRWGTSFYHNPVLDKNLIEKIISPVLINNRPSAVRLGAWYAGKNPNAFYYWGDLFGFYSWVYWDRGQQFTIAFVTNIQTPHWLRPQLTSALIDIMEGKQFSSIEKPPAEIVKKDSLETIAGLYVVDSLGRLEVFIRNGLPFIRLTSGMEYKMVQVEDNTFYVPGLEPWIHFGTLKDNKFQEILWNATIVKKVGRRINESK